MLLHSYLILSSRGGPGDIGVASFNQRQSIPLGWVLALASADVTFHEEPPLYYFSTRVESALAALDRGMAAWNYNTYLRDTLGGPLTVFRTWLADFPPDTMLYLNVSELIGHSPTPEQDIEALGKLPEKVQAALTEIEEKHFTAFFYELRRLSYPFITVPITGNRARDIEILRYEIRDSGSLEGEMALQLVGVDRERKVLAESVRRINLHKEKHEEQSEITDVIPLTLFTSSLPDARRILVEELGCSVVKEDSSRLLLNAHGNEFVLAQVTQHEELFEEKE